MPKIMVVSMLKLYYIFIVVFIYKTGNLQGLSVLYYKE